MKTLFNQLFDYNYYCNRDLIERLNTLDSLPKDSVRLFNHILNAHHIWNMRVLNDKPQYGVWEAHDAKKWQDMHYENQRTSFEIITNTNDFEKRVEYENSEGRHFANDLKDILFHIINHSTHHRGQIAMDLRKNGEEPQPLDYIFYKR
mgnify:CR=1 FL=1